MIYHTIKGTKVGETIIMRDDGFPTYVIRDSFYNIGMSGYWLIRSDGVNNQIIRYHSEESFE